MKIDAKLQEWIDARKRYNLSHAQVQMARELGMVPKSLGSLANHGQERWKAPLPEFIEVQYLRRFSRERPEVVQSIEDRAKQLAAKKAVKKAKKEIRRAGPTHDSPAPGASDSGSRERDEA